MREVLTCGSHLKKRRLSEELALGCAREKKKKEFVFYSPKHVTAK
jgi:hypothetical protein